MEKKNSAGAGKWGQGPLVSEIEREGSCGPAVAASEKKFGEISPVTDGNRA